MAKVDNKLHFRCQCGEKGEATWKSKFPFGKKQWIADKCRVCRTVTDLSSIEVVPCPHCQKIVIKGEKFCMECNQPMDFNVEMLPIVCPNQDCEVTIYLPRNHKGEYVCHFCERRIKEEEIRRQMKGQGEPSKPAQLIELPSLPKMERDVIYKEKGTQFPASSRLQVSEGTYGLLVQNGVCQYPLTPGIHLLSDSSLSQAALLDAAAKGEDVVFNTEVFCVVKKLPALTHELKSNPIQAKPVGDAPAQEYEVTAKSSICCEVDDAKAFITHIGFKAMSVQDFKAEKSWMNTRAQALLSAAFDKAAHAAFEIYDASRSEYAYKAEILRLIKAEVASALEDDGLCLDDVDLLEIAIEETEESNKKQAEYQAKSAKIEIVKLPDMQEMQNKKLVISKHDKDEFEYKSRVQVSEGTYGLMLQNGACQEPLKPGSYLLADCKLEGVSRYDAAMNGDRVVFYTSLYSVIKTLPAFEWFHFAPYIDTVRDGDAPAKEYAVKVKGSIRLQVTDAKAFASLVGFRELSVAELFHAYRPAGQLPSHNVEYETGYSADNKDGWLHTRVKAILKATVEGLCQATFGSKLDARRMGMYQMDFTRQLRAEFESQLSGTGLSVINLDLSSFTADETVESKAKTEAYKAEAEKKKNEAEQQSQSREAILKAAKTQFAWEARDVELHVQDKLELKAYATFRGDCRLQVLDPEMFFSIPEVQKQLDSHTPDLVRSFFQTKLQTMIENYLAHFAQEFIDNSKITDLLDRYAYRKVTDYVLDEINHDLSRDGLKVHDLNINIPDSITASKALKDHMAISDKQDKIRAYAEKALTLKTEPILVHMKGDATVYVKAVFSGKAYLRVADADVFFATSEVKDFLASEPFVSETAVSAYYTERITPLFADIIARIVQTLVDQTNADIRELHRLASPLQANVLNLLNERVSGFGMRVDSLDMRAPVETERSEIMLTWVKMHEVQSGEALNKEIEKIANDRTIFRHNEENRVVTSMAQSDSQKKHQLDDIEISDMESSDRVEDKKHELEEKAAARAKQKADRAFNEQMDRIRKEDELGRLVDEIASARKDRSFDELRKEYERKYYIRESEINQRIREAQIQQQADIDAQAREDKAKFDRMLNDAENKRLLGDILRKIDESDLDWRKKLDEYARLQRKLGVEDQVEQDLMIAEGKAKKDLIQAKTQAEADQVLAAAAQTIKREENETFLLVGETKIKLNDAEAELLEKIARYTEDRQKRINDNNADRAERKAILDFEQRMRDRQEQVAQDMEKLKQKYEHELALRDRDDKITALEYEHRKLVFILAHLSREVLAKADVDKARIHADEEIKKAEAQYNAQHAKEQLQAAENRMKEQLRHDEEMAKHAEAYQKMMAGIQLSIEKIRNDTERNKDDNQAKVAIAQAAYADKQAMADVKQAMERMSDRMDKRYRELQQAMDKISSSHKILKEKIKNLEKHTDHPQQPPVYPPYVVGGYPPVTGVYPPHNGGVYGYNQNVLNNSSPNAGLNLDALANLDLNAMAGMVGNLLGGMNKNAAETPAAASEPIANGMKTCPVCQKPCSIHATTCEHCGTPL